MTGRATAAVLRATALGLHGGLGRAACAAAASAALAAGTCLHAQEAGPPPIEDVLEEWDEVDAPARAFRFSRGVLRVEPGGGWLRSERRYGDFRLTAVLRFVGEDTDSGIFVRADPEGTFGPGWPDRSYQVQLRNPLGNSPLPPVGGLLRHGMPRGTTDFDDAAAREAFTGTGEWQTVVIEVEGDRLRVELNGRLVTEADGIANPSGYVGIQSETGELEIRSLTVEPL